MGFYDDAAIAFLGNVDASVGLEKGIQAIEDRGRTKVGIVNEEPVAVFDRSN
jgi:hypothetical protein